MDIMILILISILVVIILIFAIAKYSKKTKLQLICKKIAKILLLGILPLSDEDREALIN